MPEPVFRALVDNLSEVEARRHVTTAQVAWLVHSALSKQKTRVTDWLPGFARSGADARGSGVQGLPRGVRADLDSARASGFLSQALLDAALMAHDLEE